MLRLIQCEFLKLKRKSFIIFTMISALLFPIPLTFGFKYFDIGGFQNEFGVETEMFDMLWQTTFGYGMQLLLPCILGIVAAILFFMERDNDTYKSLRVVPVTAPQLVIVKIIMLFFFGILFCVISTLVTIGCGVIAFEVTGIGYKLIMSIKMGIYITAGTLPLILVVVFFSKSYIFSVILCIFYSVLNNIATFMIPVLPKPLVFLLPVPLTTLWGTDNMQKSMIIGDADDLQIFRDAGLIPSEILVIIILSVFALISIILMIHHYKKGGN